MPSKRDNHARIIADAKPRQDRCKKPELQERKLASPMTVEQSHKAAPHIAICIATYLRPEGLRNLVESLNRQVLEAPGIRVTLVIADNAPDAPATEALGDIGELSHWPVIYTIEYERGIVSARNRTLNEAPVDADYIAFLDDDEEASEDWLAQMLQAMTLPDTVAVQGTVEPRYRQPPPDWIEALNLFRMGPYVQGAALPAAATNNAMADAAIIRERGLRFDPRFNITGGEDEEFFSRLRDGGGMIRAAADALVWDDVPENRMTLRWLGRRWFRMGNTLSRIALIRRQGIATRALKSVAAMGWGALTCLCLGFGSRARFYRGWLEILRGAGMVAGLLRFDFAEYSSAAVKVDRVKEG
ncbi:glycosyltransferase family 2 protein [Ruegeria sp. HKCCD7221]|uniref:glycosyltransferase family 2 protein n=2 Tax=unclassified Ruegeria TaxID=2625375 RepID=UPI0014893F28|nr:glycosyltransferase family 2 protein [Ruegeria sp. HKCCD7221]